MVKVAKVAALEGMEEVSVEQGPREELVAVADSSA